MNTKELISLYPTTGNAEIAKILGTTKENVATTAWRLGLKKSPKYLSDLNRRNAYARHKVVVL